MFHADAPASRPIRTRLRLVAALVAGIACSAAACGGASREAEVPATPIPVETRSAPSKSEPSAAVSSRPSVAPSASTTASAPPKPRSVVVYDPTSPSTVPVLSDQKEQARLLGIIFGGTKRLAAGTECPKKVGGSLADRRAKGMFAPVVVTIAKGSFTKPKAVEQLAVVANLECNAGEQATYEVVVLESDKVTVREHLENLNGLGLSAVLDVDGDEQHEFVLTTDRMWQGHSQSAAVMRIEGGHLKTLLPWSGVLSDTCLWQGSLEYDVIKAQVVPGGAPKYSTEKGTKTCDSH